MKTTLKSVLPAFLVIVFILGVAFILPKVVSADYTVIDGDCFSTATTDPLIFSEPTIDTNGNVYVTALDDFNPALQLTYFPIDDTGDPCQYRDIGLTAVGVASLVAVGDQFGLRWVDADTIEFYNFTTATALSSQVHITAIEPSWYSNGWYFSGAHGVTTDFTMANYHIYRNASIEWQQPNFYDGMTTADFNQWWVCVVVTSDIEAYYIDIEYGDTTDTDDYSDNTNTQFGNFPTYNQSFTGCHLVDKETALTSGTWYAKAVLYNNLAEIVGVTEVIEINITSGTPIDGVPAGDPSDPDGSKYADCDNFNNVIRKYGCQIMVWAFVPNQSTLTEYQGLREDLETVAPFSYYFQVEEAVSGFESSTGTIPTLTITNDALAMETEIFSPNTLDDYISPSTLSVLRTIMEVVLYLAFFSFVIYEVKHIYKK